MGFSEKYSNKRLFRKTYPLRANSLNCSSFWNTFCRITLSSSVKCAVNWSVESEDPDGVWLVSDAIIRLECDAIFCRSLLISGPRFGELLLLTDEAFDDRELMDIVTGDGLDIRLSDGVETGLELRACSDGLLLLTIYY